MILVLEAAPNGEWYLRTKDAIAYYDNADEDKTARDTPRIGYLYDWSNPNKPSENFMQMSPAPKASTTVEFKDETGDAIISFGKVHNEGESDYIIRYNTRNNTNSFSMYQSGDIADMPLPRIYAKKAELVEADGYAMAFHHTPMSLDNGQSKVAAVESPVELNATDNGDGTYVQLECRRHHQPLRPVWPDG